MPSQFVSLDLSPASPSQRGKTGRQRWKDEVRPDAGDILNRVTMVNDVVNSRTESWSDDSGLTRKVIMATLGFSSSLFGPDAEIEYDGEVIHVQEQEIP